MAKQTQDLEELNVSDLRDRAKEAGITGTSHMRKDKLVQALRHDDGEPATRGNSKTPAPHSEPVDVLTLLIEDHENVKALFNEALALESGDPSIEELAMQIVQELELHAQVEEHIFYPALKEKAVEGDSDDAKDVVLEAYVEHGSVKELIAKIKTLSSDDESYKAVLQVMSEQVEHHVEEEESEMFKHARQLLGKAELATMGQQVMEMKESIGGSSM